MKAEHIPVVECDLPNCMLRISCVARYAVALSELGGNRKKRKCPSFRWIVLKSRF